MPYPTSSGLIRVYGSGGFFGWWGWFKNDYYGRFMVYATNLDRLVYIQLKNGKQYVISCSDPVALCDALASQLQP